MFSSQKVEQKPTVFAVTFEKEARPVQNATTRMIFNLGRPEHVVPCPIRLHWLPVSFRITYKLCNPIHNIYYRCISQPSSYVTLRLRTKFRERAFSFCGPAA